MGEFDNLHSILRHLYLDMMPLCAEMAGVAKVIAGLGALIYVAVQVWKTLARAEPIDVYHPGRRNWRVPVAAVGLRRCCVRQ